MEINKELLSGKTGSISEQRELSPVTREKVLEYLKTFGLAEQLSEQEAEQFIQLAREFQLNPFKRELHCVPFGESGQRRLSVIVGYEVYIKRAERCGKLDGWKAWIEGDGEAMKAIVEIHRKDWEKPFVHEVYWKEVCQRRRDGSITGFWSRMPRFQLKKVAISQGFRLCFPDELGGMPYEAAELSIEDDVVPVERPMRTVTTPNETERSASLMVQPRDTPTASGNELQPPTGKTVFNMLDEYLAEHAEAFSEKHVEWIRAQVASTPTMTKVQQMMAYANRVVNHEPPSQRQGRNRYGRHGQAFALPADASPI